MIEICRNAMFYFTNWMFLLVILHRYIYTHINLINLTLFVLVMSSYIFYVDPGVFATPIQDSKDRTHEVIIVPNMHLHILHVLFHVTPFVLMLHLYGDYYLGQNGANTFNIAYLSSLLLIFIYTFLVDFTRMYHVHPDTSFTISALAFLAYITLSIGYKTLGRKNPR